MSLTQEKLKMPRIPDVCPSVFCPRVNTIATWACRLLSTTNVPVVAASLLLFMVSTFVVVRAQSATATLSGTVTDEVDAVIPGVNISVINIAQGFQRSTTTNSEGVF